MDKYYINLQLDPIEAESELEALVIAWLEINKDIKSKVFKITKNNLSYDRYQTLDLYSTDELNSIITKINMKKNLK